MKEAEVVVAAVESQGQDLQVRDQLPSYFDSPSLDLGRLLVVAHAEYRILAGIVSVKLCLSYLILINTIRF